MDRFIIAVAANLTSLAFCFTPIMLFLLTLIGLKNLKSRYADKFILSDTCLRCKSAKNPKSNYCLACGFTLYDTDSVTVKDLFMSR
jgi:hypothetical protein